MRHVLRLTACALLLLVACGDDGAPDSGSADSQDAGLASVDEAMGGIESGRIQLSLRALDPDDPPRGFEMAGVFAAAKSNVELPLADLTYKNLLPTATRQTAFVSDGTRAWVTTDRGVTELTDEKLEALKGGADVAGVRKLTFSHWFTGEVTEQPGDSLDGTETISYSGEIDGALVLNDIIAMTGSLGANVESTLDAEGLALVRAAMQSPQAVIIAAEEDDVARRVTFSVAFPPNRDDLREALGRLYAERVEFQLDLTEVNTSVEPPAAPTGPAAPTTQPGPAPAPPTTA